MDNSYQYILIHVINSLKYTQIKVIVISFTASCQCLCDGVHTLECSDRSPLQVPQHYRSTTSGTIMIQCSYSWYIRHTCVYGFDEKLSPFG